MEIHELERSFNEHYFSEDCDEKEIIDSLKDIIPNDVDVFIDIGASGGQYTYHVGKFLKGKTIYAVEADPMRYKILQKNCAKWSKESGNTIIPMNYALHDQDGQEIDFYTTNSNISGSLFVNEHIKNSNLEIVKVQTITLDTLCEKLMDKNIFIKMDIEGAEFKAIRGGRKIMDNHKSLQIFIEVHGWKDTVSNLYPWDFFKVLRKYNYLPKLFKKHFIIKKSNNQFSVAFANFIFIMLYKINYLRRYYFK